MKKLFCFSILQLIFAFAYCQNSPVIFNDTNVRFKGDLPVGFFRQPNGNLLRIKSNDSTFLYKLYSKNKNILFQTYECNLQGYRNGHFYDLDTANHNITEGSNSLGRIIESHTITPNGDTIEYIRKTNDTLYTWMQIKDGTKKIWQLNSNMIQNGYYRIYDLETNKIIEDGHYMAIKQNEIVDKKKYLSLTKKYNCENAFRGDGQTPDGELMTEIPIGVWNSYDKNGKLIKTVTYNWDGVFQSR